MRLVMITEAMRFIEETKPEGKVDESINEEDKRKEDKR